MDLCVAVKRLMEYAHANDSDIDLNAMYDELNAKLFDNKLPKIPVMIESNLRKGGAAYASRSKFDEYYTPTKIMMSGSVRHEDINGLKGMLAHEMAHTYIHTTVKASDLKYMDPHGKEYQQVIDDIQKKADFKISGSAEHNDKIVRKRNNVVDIFVSPRGDRYTAMIVAHGGTADSRIAEYKDRFSVEPNTVLFYGVQIPDDLAAATVARSVKSVSGRYPITKEIYDELSRNKSIPIAATNRTAMYNAPAKPLVSNE